MIYLLTIQDKRGPDFNERIKVQDWHFHEWVNRQREKVGLDFDTRREQLRRYTGKKVLDWEMEEESTSTCADCGQKIPEGQRLCNCNTSGDLGD